MMLISAFVQLRRQHRVRKMLLVSTPKIIHIVWPKEIAKWEVPVTYAHAHGDKWQAALAKDVDIYFTTYDMLEKVCKEYLKMYSRGQKIDILAMDESTKIKSSSTQRFKNLKPVFRLFTRRYGMTGNLIPQSYLDLWSQIYALDLGAALGESPTQYRLSHFIPSGYMGKSWELAEGEEEYILNKVKHLICRIGPEELDEPPLVPVPRYIRLSAKVMALYKEMEEEYILDLQERGVVVASTAGVAATKLRQICGGFVYQSGEYEAKRTAQPLHSEKIDDLKELIEELGGEPLLVGYQFLEELEMLRRAFPKARCIGGNQKMTETSAVEDAWNAGKIPLLLAPIDGISHGHNMQGHGCHIYIYSDTWKWENHFQFIKRVHRTGQKRTVFVHYAIAENTIDEMVYKSSLRKENNQAYFWELLTEAYGGEYEEEGSKGKTGGEGINPSAGKDRSAKVRGAGGKGASGKPGRRGK